MMDDDNPLEHNEPLRFKTDNRLEELEPLAYRIRGTQQSPSHTIELRSGHLWAVCNGVGDCLDKHSGLWVHEPRPSERDEVFLTLTRFASPIQALEAYNRRKEP